MKASKALDAQKAFILKQRPDGIPATDCREVGISQARCFNWKKTCDRLLPTGMRQLKLLEDEPRMLGGTNAGRNTVTFVLTS